MKTKTKTTAIKEDGKPALVPKLRFPEFIDQPVRIVQLKEVTTESTTRNAKMLAIASVMGVKKTEGIVPMEERLIASDITRYKIVRKDWFAYNPMRLNIGSIARWQGENDILVSPDYVVFKCAEAGTSRIDPAFLDNFRRSDAWENFVSEKGDGSVRIRIYYKDLACLQLALPPFEEQQKIAECLSSMDELIAAQARKLDALKTHKKGLMQQLFPAEGETVPKLRFPEFVDAGEWEEKALGTVAIFFKGKGISKAEISQNGLQPCIRYGELYTHYKETINSVISYTNTSSAALVLSQANDVLIPASGETQIDIATASCVMSDGIALGGDLNIIRAEMNGVFLAYYLSNAKKKAIAELAQGISVVHLYANQLKMLNINIPTPTEQQKIADCLSSLDDLITAQTQKLDALKTHKKGLMQRLFPAADGEA